MTTYATRDCSCEVTASLGQKRPERCDHGNRFQTAAELKPKERKPLRRVSEKREGTTRRRGSTLKRGRGFAASKAQQEKVRDLPCIVCGRDRHEGVEIHAAHVYPRRLQSCECADGVVPLCAEHHAMYDDQDRPFDLLPHLVTRGYHAELVHSIAAHEVPVTYLLEQVTGKKWEPARDSTVRGAAA